MSELIRVKINVSKIDKDRMFKGEKGTYLDVTLIPTPDDQYGNDYRAVQDIGKEAREAGEKGPILGNAKFVGGKKPQQKAAPQQRKPPVDPDLDDDQEIPF